MDKEQIQQEFDAFFEFPEGSSKTHVTSASAKLFAEHVSQAENNNLRAKLAATQDALKDKARLVRQIDVIWNGAAAAIASAKGGE